MGHPPYSGEEIGKRGQEIYETKLRSHVETRENLGKIISIDIDTGDYEIDEDLIKAGDRLLARHPGASLYGMRIGYDAVYAVGGALAKTALLDGYTLHIDFVASGHVRIQPFPRLAFGKPHLSTQEVSRDPRYQLPALL